jgi:hypothetical protein
MMKRYFSSLRISRPMAEVKDLKKLPEFSGSENLSR